MSKRTTTQGLILAGVSVLLVLLLLEPVRASVSEEAGAGRSDVLVIDLPAVPGGSEMPGVPFLHDLHTSQVSQNDCSVCHMKKDKEFVFKFKRLTDTATATDMAIYHENCVACHMERKAGGSKSGPVEGECRSCHTARPEFSSSAWVPMGLSKSLHARHVLASPIRAEINGSDQNCSACHHRYDSETKKLILEDGTEESCRYCHTAEAEAKTGTMRLASHDSCVACHQVLSAKKITSGPITCEGCHTTEKQMAIKTLDTIPRMKRNQPDAALLTGWAEPAKTVQEMDELAKGYMKPVAFNHQLHESKAESCRACHHESLKNCSECHTDTGDKKGNLIRLGQAMHDMTTTHSCMGCHDTVQKKPECAGCHDQMPQKAFRENDCQSCHNVDVNGVDLAAMDKAGIKAFAEEASDAYLEAFKPVSREKIPETVTIGQLSNEYEPSVMPHAKIITAIQTQIEDSRMAAVFHGNGTTLCQGCHHNSPATDTPQNCGACHGKTRIPGDTRPSLKAAYHGQCITCHDRMEVKSVAARDCTKCHKPKD